MHLSLSALPLCLSPVHKKFLLRDIHDLCIITGYRLNDVIRFPTRTASDLTGSEALLLTAHRGLFPQRLSSLNLKCVVVQNSWTIHARSIDLQSLKFIYVTFQEICTTSQKKLTPLAKPVREIRSSCRHFPEFAGVFTETATLSKEIYIYILCRLGHAIRRKSPEKWTTKSWFRLHDNAPDHRSVSVKDFLGKNDVTTLEHPLHSPDLAAVDFTCSLYWNQYWRDGAFVVLLISLRMRRKSWKGFREKVSRNASNTFTVAGRSV